MDYIQELLTWWPDHQVTISSRQEQTERHAQWSIMWVARLEKDGKVVMLSKVLEAKTSSTDINQALQGLNALVKEQEYDPNEN